MDNAYGEFQITFKGPPAEALDFIRSALSDNTKPQAPKDETDQKGHDADIMLDLLRDTEAKDKVADKYDSMLRAKDTATIHRVVARTTLIGQLLSHVFVADDIDEDEIDGKPTKKQRARYA